MPQIDSAFEGDRLAKVIARAGLCSRRDAELWIKDGRVAVNGKIIRTPAFNVTPKDKVKVDGQLLTAREGTRVWLYHKPPGLVVTEKDPEGRATIFEALEREGLPRVVSIGRLDINTEGLLLLTNDGGLKRVLELPATGWVRRYRVRAFGSITQPQLDALKVGLEVDGVNYGPIEAFLEREQGSNVWLVLSLREGKNREVKNVLGALGLQVNRLIRVSFGPFQLSDLPVGGVEVVKAKVLRDQLGKRLADEAGVDFDSEMPEPAATKLARRTANPHLRASAPGKEAPQQRRAVRERTAPFHFVDDEAGSPRSKDRPMAPDRPGGRNPRRAPPAPREDRTERPAKPRKVFNADGTESVFEAKTYGKKPRPDAAADGKPPFKKSFDRGEGGGERKPFARGPRKEFGDRPPRGESRGPRKDFGDRPPRKEFGDRSARKEFGDRPPRAGGDDRPKRPYSPRGGDAGGGGRPSRGFGDRPGRGPRPDGAGDRPKRPYSPRPEGSGDRAKRPYSARPAGDGADRPKRSFGDKPRGSRPGGDDRPKRPRGSGPQGDRPRRPRPPKA